MEDPSYGLGGDQTVERSVIEDKKKRKRANDKKYRDKKKQEAEDTKTELKRIKVENAELEKNYAELGKKYAELEKKYAKLEKNYTELEENHGQLKNYMDQQPTWINMCQPFFQLPIEWTLDNTFATREEVLPVHHTPFYQSGIAMRSGGSTTIESIGIRQSRVSQEWAHENSSELLVPTHEDTSKLFVPTHEVGSELLVPTYEDQSLNVDDYLIDNEEIPGLKQQ